MENFKHIGLFAGIGGFELAAKWMGWETVAWCEWNPFCQRVLKYHFPEAEGFGDITKTDFKKYANKIDILTGGFPCQPYSTAGKRLGKQDERHLWPEMLRAIREISPRWVVGENVRGLTNWNGGMVFDEVQADLEAEGYEIIPFLLPAAGVGAPHRRDRIWFIAHSGSSRIRSSSGPTNHKGWQAGQNRATGIRQTHRPPSADWINSTSSNDTNPNGNRWFKDKRTDETESLTKNDGYTHGQGLENRRQQPNGKEQQAIIGTGNRWETWPTQPPICGGNDGLPSELDGVTFPRWRRESIQAYGNAIVPEVAFEIFKALVQLPGNDDVRLPEYYAEIPQPGKQFHTGSVKRVE